MGKLVKYVSDGLQRNYVLGYNLEDKENLHQYVKVYQKHKGTYVYYKSKISAPSFDEVELIMSCISTRDITTMQNNELRSIVVKFFPDVSPKTQQQMVAVIEDIVKRLLQNQSLSSTLIKNAFVKILKAFDSTFLDCLQYYDKYQDTHVLYYGEVSKYDLLSFEALLGLGIDVVILSTTAEALSLTGFKFNIFKGEFTSFAYLEPTLLGEDVDTPVECNSWIKVKDKDSLDNYMDTIFKKPVRIEGEGKKFRTACIGFTGVLNESAYELTLYNYYLANKDNWLLIEGKYQTPTYEEIEDYRKVYSKYISVEQILDEYYYFMNTVFPKRVSVAFKKLTENMSDSNKTVYTVWLLRICNTLFKELAEVNTIPVIVLFGEVDKKVQDFIEVLKELPLDIVHFCTHKSWELQGKGINYYVVGSSSMKLEKYPLSMQKMGQVETVAYNAARELDTILYDGKIMARFKQFKAINPIVLKTTYEEVDILWNEPAKFRPSYSVEGDVVTIPTIFMKVNGVGKDKRAFIDSILKKKNQDTFIINCFPYISDSCVLSDMEDMFGSGLVSLDNKLIANTQLEFDYSSCYNFCKHVIYNNTIDFDKVKQSIYWKYGVYSIETQNLLCERIQNMLTLNWIRKFDNKVVYKILTVLLNIDDRLVQLIHKFDFTSNIPKLIYFNSGNRPCSLEDCILLMFIKTLGFDILVYAPTGYTVIENYIGEEYFTKVEIGDYAFDIDSKEIEKKYTTVDKKKGFLDFLFT